MADYLPECDALLYHLPDGGELEISFVVLNGEEIHHERDSEILNDALIEVLEKLDLCL
jgi:hypothetical protein